MKAHPLCVCVRVWPCVKQLWLPNRVRLCAQQCADKVSDYVRMRLNRWVVLSAETGWRKCPFDAAEWKINWLAHCIQLPVFRVFRTTRMAWHLQKLRAAFELRGWLPWRQVLQQWPASWTGLSQSRAGQSCFMFLQFTFPDTLPRRLFCCQRKIKTNTHTLVSSPGVTAYCRGKKSNTTCGVRSH